MGGERSAGRSAAVPGLSRVKVVQYQGCVEPLLFTHLFLHANLP